MTCDSPDLIVAVLRECEPARLSNFSLMGDEDYALLAREVAKDFPYLTIQDLRDSMMLGIKGKLDAYKNRPTNFTRVYQWVETRAPYSLGYWQTKYPELMRWAELCKVLDTLLPKLQAKYAEFGDTGIEFMVKEHICQTRYPYYYKQQKNPDLSANDAELAAYQYIKHHLFPIFAAQYPDFAAKHPNLF